MQDGATISGYRLTGRTRISELGTWNDAISPDGVPSGVLRFDPRAVAAPDARERLVSAVGADRRLVRSGLPSLLPVADLVTARGEVWLITSRPAIPTVSDLLTGGTGPDSGSAGTILVEIAQALLSLHAAGLTHGSLHPGTVVIAEDGSAILAERGLMAAIRGDSPPVERDIAAWSALARTLSASWASGDAARLFDRAASAASTGGLAAARDTLVAGREVLPPGFTTRDRLVETLHRWYAADVPTSPAPSGPDPGQIVTLLHADRAGSVRTAPPARPAPDGDMMMRFGPGVPTEDPDVPQSTAERIWRSGQDQLATLHGREGSRGTPRRGRRRATAWAGAILLAVLIAAGILWLRQSPGPAVAVEKVDVRGPKKTLSCDGTATIVGVVTTNGGEGSIRYVWLRSDGQKLAEQELRVLSGPTSVELPLHWKVSGESSGFKGTATLRVLSPTTSGKAVQGKATFSYKCEVH
ncbi:hypothetical protein [Planotetraspora kaengkrachanensis]|uniref:Ig-like domain-containing protein n=1 Tax=Planotetraspora kaengkrachanensis TaxID=575193 RepID=A0A8J3PRL1_9ACTN|nr:hypothetical protein [Planotetraspora kaengkrachanensis]GIG78078.1 hypothetical protein Pka01_12050 [Planotetraspora kaengkrachanensis]